MENEPIINKEQEKRPIELVVLPLITFKSGTVKYKLKESPGKRNASQSQTGQICPANQNEDGQSHLLQYEPETSKLYFKVPDQKLLKKTGEIKYTTLECADITAADLKITSKFGSWDTMTCRLLVECRHPLLLWSTMSTVKQMETPSDVTFVATRQESCMVRATFSLSYATNLRDILHELKMAQVKERKSLQQKHKEGCEKNTPLPTKMREGLPEWVNYIPAKWYSCTVRKSIEYVLAIYTLLTLTWAVWQLYKHVHFIRQYLRPIILLVEFYLEILKGWFNWIDHLTEILSVYWWAYMKPVYLLATPVYVGLSQIFKPLRNVAGLVSVFCAPIVKSLQTLITVVKSITETARGFSGVVLQPFRKLFEMCTAMCHVVATSTLMQFVLTKYHQFGLDRLVHEATHGGLDPLKAQVVVLRDLVIRCIRQIFYGLKFFVTRIYFVHLFVKRERGYIDEQENEAAKTKVD